MKIVVLICRILLGLMFILFGANLIHTFLPQPPVPAGSPVAAFFGLFMASGWIKIIGLVQVIGGLLVLLGRTTPLGLVFLAPVLVNIWCFHLLLMGGAGIAPGLVATLLWLILAYAYRSHLSGILSTSASPTV